MSEQLTPEQLIELSQGKAPLPLTPLPVTPIEDKPTDLMRPSSDPHELILSDGRKVVLQRYKTPTKLLVAKCLSTDSMNQLLTVYFNSITWVRSINGGPVPELRKREDFEWIATQLGDDGLEEVAQEVLMMNLPEDVREQLKKS